MSPRQPTPEERDQRLVLPLDPETALRALLRVDPDAPPKDHSDEDACGSSANTPEP